jgi:8-oxo-dGTP diphosphatase
MSTRRGGLPGNVRRTGLTIGHPGPQVARRIVSFQTPDGDAAQADKRYFLIRANNLQLSDERWTELERQVMTESR